MVRFDSQRESNSAIPDNEVTKTIDNHRWQIYKSLFATVRECKFYAMLIRLYIRVLHYYVR